MLRNASCRILKIGAGVRTDSGFGLTIVREIDFASRAIIANPNEAKTL
jgi:hypothetical protein